MAEPDGNPPPSSPLPPSEPSAPPSSDLPEALTPAPRVNPPSVFNQKDAAVPGPASPAGFNDFLAWVQTLAGAPPPPPADAAWETLSRKEKKFQRRDPEASRKDVTAEAPEPLSPESSDTDRTPTARGDLREPGRLPPMRKRRQKSPSVTNPRKYRGLSKWLLPLALLAGAFFLGRATVTRNNPAPISVVPRSSLERPNLDAPTADLINQAMAAEGQSDFAKAASLLERVQGERIRVAGLDYHLALLAYEANDLPRALVLLNQSMEKGENVAACYNLRGTLNNRTKGIIRGLDDLATATQFDPFEAKYFYFQGEALRRAGKPQAGLQQLQLALDRLREPSQEGIYRLKIRLAQIELGRQDEFKSQLAEELRRNPPALDWILTAAAVEMHGGRFDAAAGYLDQALTLVDQETLNVRLRDYFFYGFANEKSLVRFYAPILHPNAPPAAAAPKASEPPPANPATPIPADASPAPTLAPSLHP